MIPSLRRQAVVQAGVGLLACFVFLPHNVDAAPIKSVGVSAATTQGEVPDSVRKRIESSISAIGNRVFVGKEENIFRLNAVQYNKVLADIVNRVVNLWYTHIDFCGVTAGRGNHTGRQYRN